MKQNDDFDIYRGGWRLGSVTAGTLSVDKYHTEWSIQDPSTLFAQFSHETLDLSEIGYIKSLEGRTAILYRTKAAGCHPYVFVDLPNHYVAVAFDVEECCDVLAKRNSPLDRSKPVFCLYGAGQVAALWIRPRRRSCIGAVYRVYTDVVEAPDERASSRLREERRRNALRGRQKALARFLTDPFHFNCDEPEFLISKTRRLIEYRPGTCSFNDLLPMRMPSGKRTASHTIRL